jgi:hypothetical protein
LDLDVEDEGDGVDDSGDVHQTSACRFDVFDSIVGNVVARDETDV